MRLYFSCEIVSVTPWLQTPGQARLPALYDNHKTDTGIAPVAHCPHASHCVHQEHATFSTITIVIAHMRIAPQEHTLAHNPHELQYSFRNTGISAIIRLPPQCRLLVRYYPAVPGISMTFVTKYTGHLDQGFLVPNNDPVVVHP